MKIKTVKISNKFYFIFITFLLILFAHRSLSYLSHIYDGGHHGSLFQNALEILNGKLPYKDYFSQYGHLNDLINSLTVYVFNKDIFGIYINTTLFYFLSVFILGYVSFKLSNIYSFFFAVLILIFNHPIPEYPWPNYSAFLFLTLSVLIFNLKNNYQLFVSSFFLGISILCRENFYIFIIPSWIFLSFLIYIRYRELIKLSYFLFGLIIPISIFFIFLNLNNIFDEWFRFQMLPFLYVDAYDTTLTSLIKNFFIFFSTEVIFNLVEKPQYLSILLIYLFNVFVFFEEIFLKKIKNIKVIFICTLCLSSFIVSINYEIFRLYTSITLGLPIIFYRLHLNKFKDTAFIYIFILIFISIYSFAYYPSGNVKFYKNINFDLSYKNKEIQYFKNQKWTSDKWNFTKNFQTTDSKIFNRCNIEYILNLTPNAFILALSNFSRVQNSHIFNDHLGLEFPLFFQRDFNKKINNLIRQQNIYIVTTANNIKILKTNLKDYFELASISFYESKEIIYKILVPKDCYQKIIY